MWGTLVEMSPKEDLAEKGKSREGTSELLTAEAQPGSKRQQ